MRTECIDAVVNSIGRKLKPGEAEGIEKKINDNMAMLARQDPQAWGKLSLNERRFAAATAAAEQFKADAAMKLQRTAMNVVIKAKLAQRFNDQTLQGVTGANAVERILNQSDAYVKGVSHENFSLMMDAIDSADPRFLGLLGNKIADDNFIREVFSEDSGSSLAKRGVKAWLEIIERMRTRFNKAGGDIGKLDYGYVPQSHDQVRILKTGRENWITKISTKLDRSRYVDDAGDRLDDAGFLKMLGEVYETLSTGGINKLQPMKQTFGTSFADRGSKSRQLHFNNADAWLEYHKDYGRGSLFDSMQAHVQALSRNIAVLEELGPSPRTSFDMLADLAIKNDGKVTSVGAAFADLESLYRVLTDENNYAINPQIADINQGIRNFTVAVKLQGVLLSSVNDVPTLIATAKYHQLPIFRTLGNVLKSFGTEYRDYANVTGMVTDSIIQDMSRFADGNMAQGWTSKLAHTTNKLSLISKWTDSLKRGFQITMMGALGKMKDTPWQKLDKADLKRLKFQGVTPEIWAVWQAAKSEDWKGSKMLTPESIRNIPDELLPGDPDRARSEAVARLLGYIVDESEYAVTTPDLTTRASLGGGTQKGTLPGELARHMSLFKSFPLAMANRHIRRAIAMNGESGTPGYAVSLLVGMIGFGALSVQLKSLVAGQDPADMSEPKFWGKAMAQGGGLGIYGDLLYTGLGGYNRAGQANWASLGGPVFGTLGDFGNVTLGNIGDVMRGEKTDMGAELLRFTKQNTPFINLWYARAAVDHLLLQDMQESLSPGYLNKMRARAYKDFGQQYWWEPGEITPDRLPDFENAIGE